MVRAVDKDDANADALQRSIISEAIYPFILFYCMCIFMSR